MIEINLEAKNPEQQLLKDYLQQNASKILIDKINNGVKLTKDGKTLINKKYLDTFLNYANQEAQKLAEKGARFACIKSDTVFSWLMHYMEEQEIEGKLFNEDGTKYKPVISSYVVSINRSYKTGKPLPEVQSYEQAKIQIRKDDSLKPLKELFKGKDLERFFLYIGRQNSNPHSYLDYMKACNYLGLDMTLPKHRFPNDFKRWHDIRIDEYRTAKALADEKEREKLYSQFAAVADKYMALQRTKENYAVIIARSPADLIHEGEVLSHYVGRMNYEQKFVREETLIFFVRSINSPDIPFVTVEYSLQNNKVLQCYGKSDTKPDDTVLTYVNKVWLPYANRKIKKLSA